MLCLIIFSSISLPRKLFLLPSDRCNLIDTKWRTRRQREWARAMDKKCPKINCNIHWCTLLSLDLLAMTRGTFLWANHIWPNIEIPNETWYRWLIACSLSSLLVTWSPLSLSSLFRSLCPSSHYNYRWQASHWLLAQLINLSLHACISHSTSSPDYLINESVVSIYSSYLSPRVKMTKQIHVYTRETYMHVLSETSAFLSGDLFSFDVFISQLICLTHMRRNCMKVWAGFSESLASLEWLYSLWSITSAHCDDGLPVSCLLWQGQPAFLVDCVFFASSLSPSSSSCLLMCTCLLESSGKWQFKWSQLFAFAFNFRNAIQIIPLFLSETEMTTVKRRRRRRRRKKKRNNKQKRRRFNFTF